MDTNHNRFTFSKNEDRSSFKDCERNETIITLQDGILNGESIDEKTLRMAAASVVSRLNEKEEYYAIFLQPLGRTVFLRRKRKLDEKTVYTIIGLGRSFYNTGMLSWDYEDLTIETPTATISASRSRK
ncbi:hypothetical protein IMZ31_22450 (plasmid) [Pontibacillus sp. ALD_SL1]|uniref:hypothetical protein n=1 Tax=Pontibacillus sp. ALD_SL1 TaxID=2777185 RepID=UPI001A95C76A|nr:hypothetical protein [Pontibacillus sp. ALD_SL1]QST02217.1 hypothetical protein IMZ31_22450 [Pontibacillus sp. ALD_SL1]